MGEKDGPRGKKYVDNHMHCKLKEEDEKRATKRFFPIFALLLC